MKKHAAPLFVLECKGSHRFEDHLMDPTVTDWGHPYGSRLTWTCRSCGDVWGRAG